MNRTVLITGATAGIGEAFARFFAASGDSLLLIARSEEKLAAACALFAKENPHATYQYIRADLSRPQDADAVCAQLQRMSVDILINNAGFGVTGAFSESDPAQTEDMMYLNMLTLTKFTHAVLPNMLMKNSGYILNVGSVSSFMPNPYGNVKGYHKSADREDTKL